MRIESHSPPRHLRRPALAVICAATASVTLFTASCGSGGPSTAPPSPTQTTSAPQTSSTPETPPTESASTTTPTDSASGPATPTAATQYLQELEPLSSSNGAETGSADVNGQNYGRSVSFRVDKGYIPVNDAEYNLGRHWRTFEATIGLRDDAPTGCKLKFEAFADGKPINNVTLPLGEVRDLKLDVSNVLRLKIQVTYASPTDISNYCYGVLGDARLEA